ncbi:MAG: hypothetical protein LBS00_00195 [Synergistaceae bacterium]|jgi:hypothetical protein|nr:hypothetical protein [Synergistaceae bacterium]
MVMEAYHGYTENGMVIPIGSPVIPDGLKVIITVLDAPSILDVSSMQDRALEQKKALETFRKGLDSCPPLPSEFDEIIETRVNIARELEL